MPQLAWLDAQGPPAFPPTRDALPDPNGLLAAGGALTPDWLITAYSRGIFPWFSEGEPILWWSPAPRMVLAPGAMVPPRSLRKAFRRQPVSLSVNRDFDRVVDACRAPRPGQGGTWITAAMVAAYRRLHRLGWAHSIEVRDGDDLIGGLYGLGIGSVFFGESMFSARANASKYAFLALSDWTHRAGLTMIDCQVYNDHLYRLGAREVDRTTFERALPRRPEPLSPPDAAGLNKTLRRRLAAAPEDPGSREGRHEE